jgi:AraC-like DNA-binding protein
MNRRDFQSRALQDRDAPELLGDILEEQIARIQGQQLRLAVPVSLRPFESYRRMHFHQGFEIPIQCFGRAVWELLEGRISASPGQVILFPRGVAHKEFLGPGAPYNFNMNLFVDRDSFSFHPFINHHGDDPGFNRCGYFRFMSFEGVSVVFDICGEIVSEVQRCGRADSQLCQTLLLSVFMLIRNYIQSVGPSVPPAISYLVVRCRKEILRYLCSTSLNVAWLAERLLCSSDYLSHLFHQQTGVRISAFINSERVKLGKYLLQSSAMNVSEIALSCGYADPNYFARVFKKLGFQTPRQYRNSNTEAGC